MSPYEFRLLWYVGRYGPLTAGELAERINRSEQRLVIESRIVANQLRGLHQRGLITATTHQPHTYRATPDGQDYVNA